MPDPFSPDSIYYVAEQIPEVAGRYADKEKVYPVATCPKCHAVNVPFYVGWLLVDRIIYCLNCHTQCAPQNIIGYATNEELDQHGWQSEI